MVLPGSLQAWIKEVLPATLVRPKSRRDFWDAKIAANQRRDRRVTRTLRAQGWRVVRLWEHALRPAQAARTMGRLKGEK